MHHYAVIAFNVHLFEDTEAYAQILDIIPLGALVVRKLLSANTSIKPNLEVPAAMLLCGVPVPWRYHEVVDYHGLSSAVLSHGIFLNWREILLAESIKVSFDLLGQGPEVGECIRCSAQVVSETAGATAIVHHGLPLGRSPQTLELAKKSERIDGDDLSLLQGGRRDNLELEVVQLLLVHQLDHHLLVVLQSFLVIHNLILSLLLRSY